MLVVVVAAVVLAMFLGLRGQSAAPFGAKSPGQGRFALAPGAGMVSTPSGFSGDRTGGSGGNSLGCLDSRHYTDGVEIRNRTHAPVSVLDAHWRSPAPGLVEQVATQFLLSPATRVGDGLTIYNWNRTSTPPLTIPPGRSASVQSDFAFRHCGQLAGGRSLAVPGSLIIRYRSSGGVRQKTIAFPGARFVVVAGPRRLTCAPVAGSTSLVSSNLSCAAAQRAALACQVLSHKGYGGCLSGKALWECDRVVRGASILETCDRAAREKNVFGARDSAYTELPHGFKVRWNAAS
jgi:hypothetical protein